MDRVKQVPPSALLDGPAKLLRCCGPSVIVELRLIPQASGQGTVTEKKIARIIRSILRFIAQCHAYRDVKPDNFLFLSKDDNSPLRATDFGLSIR